MAVGWIGSPKDRGVCEVPDVVKCAGREHFLVRTSSMSIPWQKDEVSSMVAPSFLPRSIPTRWASRLEFDHPYSSGCFALRRISTAFVMAWSTDTSWPSIFGIVLSVNRAWKWPCPFRHRFLTWEIAPVFNVSSMSSHRSEQPVHTAMKSPIQTL